MLLFWVWRLGKRRGKKQATRGGRPPGDRRATAATSGRVRVTVRVRAMPAAPARRTPGPPRAADATPGRLSDDPEVRWVLEQAEADRPWWAL